MKSLFFTLTVLFLCLSFAEATNPPVGVDYPGNRDGSKPDCCSGNSMGGDRNPLQFNACLVSKDCQSTPQNTTPGIDSNSGTGVGTDGKRGN